MATAGPTMRPPKRRWVIRRSKRSLSGRAARARRGIASAARPPPHRSGLASCTGIDAERQPRILETKLPMTQRGSRPAKKHRLANVRRSASGKWVSRYRACGESGLLDRSSTPECVANRTDERRVLAVAAVRRLRLTSAEIAELLGMALSMVSGILTRIRMGRLGRLVWS